MTIPLATPLYADVGAEKLTSKDGGAPTIPPFVAGDLKRFALQLQERTDSGLVAKQVNVRSMRVSLGKVQEPPTGGQFSVTNGTDESAFISYNATPADFTAALEGIVDVTDCTSPALGLWLFRREDYSQLPAAFDVVKNRLFPRATVRVRSYEADPGDWWHELQLIQLPAAFSSSFEVVLPPPPKIERVKTGAPRVVGSSANTNEVQRLYLPPNFRGSYSLEFDYRESSLLGQQDGIEEIAAALNALYTDEKERFKVTNPENDFAYIEFAGPLAEAPQEEIKVKVHSFEPGVLEFSLNLARPELYALLRTEKVVELPLEIELEVIDNEEDAADPATPGRPVTIAQQLVKVYREQAFDELREVQAIEWAKPTQPRDYIPFTEDQVITGQQHYTAIFGDGVHTQFSFLFNLGTPWISGVTVRENKPFGRFLVEGTDFSLAAGSDTNNELVLTLAAGVDVPAVNALAICITTAGPKSAFQAHTHTIGQVIGLTEALAALGERLANIENKLPYTTPAVREESSDSELQFELPNFFAQYPGRYLSENFTQPQKIARPAALLPAVHDAEPEAIGPILPSASASRQVQEFSVATLAEDAAEGATSIKIAEPFALHTGEQISFDLENWHTVGIVPLNGVTIPISPALINDVYTGDPLHRRLNRPYAREAFVWSGAPLILPGRRGTVATGALIASDGRQWYPVSPLDGKTSYYPSDFERQLLTYAINDRLLRPGGELELSFKFAAQLISANTAAQCVLVVEFGETPQDTTPAPIGVNLQNITWNATPLLAQRIILNAQRVDGTFGIKIRRGLDNTFAADRQLYGLWEAAGSAPSSANIVLRARVVEFDTENSVPLARGAVWIGATDGKLKITNA